jgi:hypothetical protein
VSLPSAGDEKARASQAGSGHRAEGIDRSPVDFRNHLHQAMLRKKYMKGAKPQRRLGRQELRNRPFMEGNEAYLYRK